MKSVLPILFICINFKLVPIEHIFCYHFRGHQKIQRLNLMHASDYIQMDVQQLQKSVDDNKKKDKNCAKNVE